MISEKVSRIVSFGSNRNRIAQLVGSLLIIIILLFFTMMASSAIVFGQDESELNVEMNTLLVCVDEQAVINNNEPSCSTGIAALEQIGIPYTVLYAASQELTDAYLWDGSQHGNFSGVVLATGTLGYDNNGNWESAFTSGEWDLLHQYEARFSLREASLYTYPTQDFGLQYIDTVDTSVTPLQTSLTPPGQEIFKYINPAAVLTFEDAWGYLAQPSFLATPSAEDTTPLIQTANGETVAAIHYNPDGRVTLAVTVDSNPNLLHSQILAYGVMSWVNRGIFLGQRHVYLLPQIDDYFIGDEIWDPATNTTLTDEHRITASDLDWIAAWQQNVNVSRPTADNLRIDMVFNGEGTTAYGENDPLTAKSKELESVFYWTNHTYSHADLDHSNYATSLSEITMNNDTALDLGLTRYSTASLVTGDMLGLDNPNFLAAAVDAGVEYLAGNASIPEQDNPSPNTGIINQYEPSILQIPRHPNNIYYNVSSPEQEVSEYNYIYNSYWGRDLTYEEILDVESDMLLHFLLSYDIDPLMFHQSNLGVYNSPTYGQGAMLTDFLEATLDKYESVFNLPILSLSFDEVGQEMRNRAACNAAGLSGIVGGGSLNVSSAGACIAPVTGLTGIDSEIYGAETISHLTLPGGDTFATSPNDTLQVSNKKPLSDSTVSNGLPYISIGYTDPVWGIDVSNVRMSVDGNDVTSEAVVTNSYMSYVPSAADALAGGSHTVHVTIPSRSAQTADLEWQFTVPVPSLTLGLGDVFWASLADYENNLLSVNYQVQNVGEGVGKQTTLEGSVATNGVLLFSPAPVNYDDLAPGQLLDLTLKYMIPPGVSNFRATVYLTCKDDAGATYGMPSPGP